MSKSIRKEEFIVCASIKIEWYDGYHKRDTEFLGVDYKVIRNDPVYEMFYDDYKFLTEVEGFITNKNRFVDQKEALEITGWKNKLYFKDKDYLTPEDLLYYQSLIY